MRRCLKYLENVTDAATSIIGMLCRFFQTLYTCTYVFHCRPLFIHVHFLNVQPVSFPSTSIPSTSGTNPRSCERVCWRYMSRAMCMITQTLKDAKYTCVYCMCNNTLGPYTKNNVPPQASKTKGMGVLESWSDNVVNHFWWCCESYAKDVDLLKVTTSTCIYSYVLYLLVSKHFLKVMHTCTMCAYMYNVRIHVQKRVFTIIVLVHICTYMYVFIKTSHFHRLSGLAFSTMFVMNIHGVLGSVNTTN